MIQLSNESETLFIPLYGKALMSRTNTIITDKKAEEIVDNIDYDFTKLKVAKKVQVFMSLRAAIIDDYADSFIVKNPDCIVLHLGCGLDSRVLRVSNQAKCWYDLDYFDVIEIKKQFFYETPQYKMISSSVTDLDWMNQIDYTSEPVLIIAEGLLMYLCENQVNELFVSLKDKFYDAEIIFDAFSKSTLKFSKYQPSLKKTEAKILWGADSPKEIEDFADGITYLDTKYFNDDNRIRKLNGYFRFMFNITKNMKAAREAQRIFIFRLKKFI